MGKVHLLLWKYTHLDENADYMLEMRELHSFLKITKKSIHPKKCSRTFVAYCDKDGDHKISLNEWYTCFGVKGRVWLTQLSFKTVGRPLYIHVESLVTTENVRILNILGSLSLLKTVNYNPREFIMFLCLLIRNKEVHRRVFSSTEIKQAFFRRKSAVLAALCK